MKLLEITSLRANEIVCWFALVALVEALQGFGFLWLEGGAGVALLT